MARVHQQAADALFEDVVDGLPQGLHIPAHPLEYLLRRWISVADVAGGPGERPWRSVGRRGPCVSAWFLRFATATLRVRAL